jgi:membrane protein implicated in regulation of membrane protease activity
MSDSVVHTIKLGQNKHGMMFLTQERMIIISLGNFMLQMAVLAAIFLILMVPYFILIIMVMFFDLHVGYLILFVAIWFLFTIISVLILNFKFSWKKAEKRMNMPPDKILRKYRKSYQILNGDISKITIKKTIKGRAQILISSQDGEYSFIIHRKDGGKIDLHKNTLKRIFGNRFNSDF